MASRRNRRRQLARPYIDLSADKPPPRTPEILARPLLEQHRGQALEIARMLRRQPGVNVRQPSHHKAPFRSLPIAYQGVGSLGSFAGSVANPSVIYFPVQWTGRCDASQQAPIGPGLESIIPAEIAFGSGVAEAFPDGYIGVLPVSGIEVHVCQLLQSTASAVNPYFDARWTLFVDNKPYPGMDRCRPSGAFGHDLLVTGTLGIQTTHAINTSPLAHLQINPGQQVYVAVYMLADISVGIQNFFAGVNIRGYRYPIQKEEPSIYGTLVDA